LVSWLHMSMKIDSISGHFKPFAIVFRWDWLKEKKATTVLTQCSITFALDLSLARHTSWHRLTASPSKIPTSNF
jgi:hypothetical protein